MVVRVLTPHALEVERGTPMSKKAKPRVTGEYNRDGYTVSVDGEEVYQAGNSPDESTSWAKDEEGLNLRTLRRYCIQTSKEFAVERSGVFVGVQRADPSD